MSFDSIGYANRIQVNTEDGTKVSYMQTYERGTGDQYFDFDNADYFDFHFQLHPRNEYSRPLIIHLADYDNDTYLAMEYYAEADGSNYNIIIDRVGIKDKRGEWIDDISYNKPDYGNKTVYRDTTGTFVIPALLSPTLDSIPIRYYYGKVSYYSNTTLAAGDAANQISLGGNIWYRETVLGDLDDLHGKLDFSTVSNRFNDYSIPCFSVEDDEDLEALSKGMEDAGNGKNPFGTYDPNLPPFENDPSGTGGGTGGYKPSGETTGIPGLPSVSAIGTGFLSIYNPSQAQLRSLAAKLWTDDFYDTILKLWNDPLEGLIAFSMVPFAPDTSGSDYVKLGNYDTEVSMPLVSSQYKIIDCGSIDVPEFWGSALDYSPYTKAEIFLPFVGVKTLDTDEVMNKTIQVMYNCDILSGSAVCMIICNGNVLYTFNCNIAATIPITGSNFSALWGGILKGAINASTMAAMTAGVAGGAVGAVAGGLTSAANTMASKHSEVEKGSGISSSSGMLGGFIPYLIIHRPVQSLPSNFGHFKGYPSNVTRTLSAVSGYTEVEYIHLDGISATDSEKEEILSLLKAGVIL